MDIDIDKKAMERMIARVRSMSSVELATKIKSYRGRSIGENLSGEFVSTTNKSQRHDIAILSAEVYEAVSLSYKSEASVEYQTYEEYFAANDDNYTLAA